MNNKAKLKALIFDVDGTLANTERDAHLLAFNQAFKQFGLNWYWSSALYAELLAITGGKLRLKHYINDYLTNFEVTTYATNIEDFAIKIHQQKTQNFIDIISQGNLPLRTGVRRLLKQAKAEGLRLAIATTTTFANVEAIISNALGVAWLDNFEVIGAGDVVPNLKPAGDIYQYVLNAMNLSADETIAFEDSENGILAANEVGLKSIITINEYTKDQQFKDALVVLDNLGEPESAFTILAGDKTKHHFVNVDYLHELYEKNY